MADRCPQCGNGAVFVCGLADCPGGGRWPPAGERARARQTDPATSKAAAASVTALTTKQEAVLDVIRWALGGIWSERSGLCDAEIIRCYESNAAVPQQSRSGIRTRRKELVTKGRLRDSGRKVRLPSGRLSIEWEVTT